MIKKLVWLLESFKKICYIIPICYQKIQSSIFLNQYRPQLPQHLHDAVAFPTPIGIVATEDNLVMLEAETVIEILTVLVTLPVEMTIARSTFHLLEAIGTNLPIVAKVRL